MPKTGLDEAVKATIKNGETPAHWSDKQLAHKDTDARWTKNGDQPFYGYNAHINADQKHKLIRAIDVTPANVDDRVPLAVMLDDSAPRQREGATVHADRGYHGEAVREMLEAKGLLDAWPGRTIRSATSTPRFANATARHRRFVPA